MIFFENPQALLLVPLLVALVVWLHNWGYKRIYLSSYRFIHPFTKIVKVKTRGSKRIATLLLKILAITLLVISLAQPYIVEKTYRRIESEAELEDILKVAKPAVVVAIDVSGSMGASIPGGIKIEVAKQVISGFVEKLPGNFDAGLIAFSDRIVTNVPVTSNHKILLDTVRRLEANGGTMYTYPLQSTLSMLKPYRIFNISVFAILVTDGLPADPEYRELLGEYSRLGIPIYTVYIGPGNDPGVEETKYIAEKTGGQQFTAETAEDLVNAFKKFSRVAEEIKVKMKTKIETIEEEEVRKPLNMYTMVIAIAIILLLLYTRYSFSKISF